jgi:hypothetical protein
MGPENVKSLFNSSFLSKFFFLIDLRNCPEAPVLEQLLVLRATPMDFLKELELQSASLK